MIMPKDDPRWMALLRGQIQHQFKFVAAAMMVSKCQRLVIFDSSPQNVDKTLNDLYAYFTKFENMVKDDLNTIFS
jgi:hypothetical protein